MAQRREPWRREEHGEWKTGNRQWKTGQLTGPPFPVFHRFCRPAAQLVVEVDGDSHAQQTDYDAERTQWLNQQRGYRVLRFTNDEVHQNIDAVVEAIAAALHPEAGG